MVARRLDRPEAVDPPLAADILAPGTRSPRTSSHGAPAHGAPSHRGPSHRARSRRRGGIALGLAFLGYLALAVVMWWQVWTTHPTSVTTCGCGDTSLFLWFLEWPAYAISHGHNPFYSTALFHPAGINLLSNTSVLAIGIPLAPITWLFGPVATLNVASTLGPALTALSMFWLLRRWVRWTPAAFVGGLIFGFSPFAFENIVGGHFMTGVLVLLPLMVACLDELLIRQRRRPLAVGALLGLLLTVQFFLGTEMLVIAVVCGVAGIVLVLIYAAVGHRADLVAHTPHALRGLGAAAVVAVVLLAYPVWFALDGPAHLGGLVWPTIKPGAGITLSNLWDLRYMTALRREMLAWGGYQGPALPQPEFLGLGACIVAIGGLLVWRKDRRLWCFGALGAVAVVLSLGVQSYWTPWRIALHLPLLDNVIPSRIAAITSLCVAVMVAVVMGRTYDSVRAWRWDAPGPAPAPRVPAREPMPASVPGHSSEAAVRGRGAKTGGGVVAGLMAGGAALLVAAVAVVPMAGAVVGNVPVTTRPVALPRWFTEAAPHLPPGQVVLTYPPPFTLDQSPEDWQAVDSLDFSMVGGSGPEAVLSRAGKERAGQAVLSAASLSFGGPPKPTPGNIKAVRRALAGWGVTMVVAPDQAPLPRYEQTTAPAVALGLFTAAIGRGPQFEHGAWVWKDVRSPDARRSISQQAFAQCTTSQQLRSPDRLAVPNCVLAASGPAT